MYAVGKKEWFSFIAQTIFSVPRYSMDTHNTVRFCLIVSNGWLKPVHVPSDVSNYCVHLRVKKQFFGPNNITYKYIHMERLSVEWSMTTLHILFYIQCTLVGKPFSFYLKWKSVFTSFDMSFLVHRKWNMNRHNFSLSEFDVFVQHSYTICLSRVISKVIDARHENALHSWLLLEDVLVFERSNTHKNKSPNAKVFYFLFFWLSGFCWWTVPHFMFCYIPSMWKRLIAPAETVFNVQFKVIDLIFPNQIQLWWTSITQALAINLSADTFNSCFV